jgi:hypothetical protein
LDQEREEMNETPKELLISRIKRRRKELWTWFLIYVTTWLTGIIWSLATNARTDVAIHFLGTSIILYIICLKCCYQIRTDLKSIDTTKASGTMDILLGLFLNPLFLGFLIPLWLFIDLRKIEEIRVKPDRELPFKPYVAQYDKRKPQVKLPIYLKIVGTLIFILITAIIIFCVIAWLGILAWQTGDG